MSRVSKQSTTIGILASATATLAAMTAYNIYRARKPSANMPLAERRGLAMYRPAPILAFLWPPERCTLV